MSDNLLRTAKIGVVFAAIYLGYTVADAVREDPYRSLWHDLLHEIVSLYPYMELTHSVP